MIIEATEMSTIRMQHGEPFVTIFFVGPKGGSREMHRLDITEAGKLAAALAEVVRHWRQRP